MTMNFKSGHGIRYLETRAKKRWCRALSLGLIVWLTSLPAHAEVGLQPGGGSGTTYCGNTVLNFSGDPVYKYKGDTFSLARNDGNTLTCNGQISSVVPVVSAPSTVGRGKNCKVYGLMGIGRAEYVASAPPDVCGDSDSMSGSTMLGGQMGLTTYRPFQRTAQGYADLALQHAFLPHTLAEGLKVVADVRNSGTAFNNFKERCDAISVTCPGSATVVKGTPLIRFIEPQVFASSPGTFLSTGVFECAWYCPN